MYQVTIEPIGVTVEVEQGQTILDAALRNGIWLPHACSHGTCGTCKVDLLEGQVDNGDVSPFALMDFECDEGKCLICCATPESDLVIEADIDEEPDARHVPLQDFTGTIAELTDLTPTIKGVFIELDGNGIEFQSGQYIKVKLPGVEVSRAFSLANPESRTERLELNVRKVDGGEATTYIHENLKVGDKIEFSGPWGQFFVRKSDPKPIIFMAGGSGLSSPKSMLLDLIENGDRRDITLIYGARNFSELYYHQLFLKLQEQHENFKYVPALSEPGGGDIWTGAVGLVHDVACQYFDGDFRGHKAYLCGPPLMIEACIRVLMQGRLFERDIYTEKFTTHADAENGVAESPLFKCI